MHSPRKMFALSLATALAVQPTIDAQHIPPSPPPCTVDGGCYPKHITWGHYGTRWRTWPGVDFSDAEERARGTSVLRGTDVPPPEEEERQAPPPLEPSKPEGESEEEKPPIDTPPLNLPPLPFQLPAPAARPGAPAETNGTDRPPLLPFGQPTAPANPTPPAPGTFRPLPGTEGTSPAPGNLPRPAEVPLSPPGSYLPPAGRQLPATANEQDAPPALPLNFTQSSGSAGAQAVAAQSSQARRLPAPPAFRTDNGVIPAGADLRTGVRHQAQPAVYAPASDPPPSLPAFGR